MSIFKKLTDVQNELEAPKSQYNKFGNYHYRSCEDILGALKPLLKKHKLSIMISDKIVFIENRFYVEATVNLYDYESDTSHSVSAYAREEESKKGMDAAQVTGSVSSYARKYALNGMFAIDDSKDPDTKDNSESNQSKDTPKSEDKKPSISQAQVKRLIAIAATAEKDVEHIKAQVLKVYKKTHLNEMTKAEYDRIVKWYEEGCPVKGK